MIFLTFSIFNTSLQQIALFQFGLKRRTFLSRIITFRCQLLYNFCGHSLFIILLFNKGWFVAPTQAYYCATVLFSAYFTYSRYSIVSSALRRSWRSELVASRYSVSACLLCSELFDTISHNLVLISCVSFNCSSHFRNWDTKTLAVSFETPRISAIWSCRFLSVWSLRGIPWLILNPFSKRHHFQPVSTNVPFLPSIRRFRALEQLFAPAISCTCVPHASLAFLPHRHYGVDYGPSVIKLDIIFRLTDHSMHSNLIIFIAATEEGFPHLKLLHQYDQLARAPVSGAWWTHPKADEVWAHYSLKMHSFHSKLRILNHLQVL